MAITQQTPYNNYTGNGSTTVFAYTFKLFLASDLKVYLDGVLQTETTHYTVSGVGTESGGNVTFVAAPASSVAVQLVRSIPYNRLVDYQTSGDLLANTLDDDLDRVVAQVQQLEQAVVDSVTAPLPGAAYDAGGRRIVNLADPVGAQDAMTYASALASVTTAAASASAAQSAQSAAEVAQAAAEAAFDSFDDRYLGAKAADPTLDNDGNALVEGAIYWNTTLKNFKVWSGTAWQAWQYSIPDGDKGDITVSGSGATWTLDPSVVSSFARTLLDDADADAARTTLGVTSYSAATTTTAGVVELATSAEAAAGTDAVRAITPAGLATSVIGMSGTNGQTWQDLTGSRAIGTTYYNTTGRPISVVVVYTSANSVTYTNLTVAGVLTEGGNAPGSGTYAYKLAAIVPPGASYVISGGSPTLFRWSELR